MLQKFDANYKYLKQFFFINKITHLLLLSWFRLIRNTVYTRKFLLTKILVT